MELTERVKEVIKQKANQYAPNECCGFVVIRRDDEKMATFNSINIAEKKEEEFAIRMKDYVLADRLGDIIGIYHSHTKGDNGFYQADINISYQLELTNYLYEMETDKFYTYNPVEENGKVD